MSKADPVTGQAAVTPGGAGRGVRLAPLTIALAAGGLMLALMIVDVPLASLARQSLNADTGSVPVWISAPFAVLGFVLAWRKPANPLGWIFLGGAFFGVLSQDASFYTVADYRLRHGSLPLGWAALLAQPGWAPAITLYGLVVLLFPDGRPPSSRWRWVVRAYLATGLLWIAGTITLTAGAIIGHHTQVDSGGSLLLLSGTDRAAAWWNVVQALFFPLLAVCWLASLAGQVLSYRRSSGARRQQLKWLASGAAAGLAGVVLYEVLPGGHGLFGLTGGVAGAAGVLAFPACMGVAIFRYRLFDIDRLISRTLAYAIVTALLVGVYAAIVLLATQVVTLTTPVAVAASTLAAAALFNPLRRRVQHMVDQRFNRARYDADRAVTAFAARLTAAVDLGSVRDDLAATVRQTLEPAHVSVWISQGR